jgi:hypothetical protein
MANKNPILKLENLTPFTSQNQPAKRGRKRNVFGALAKENNLSLTDCVMFLRTS